MKINKSLEIHANMLKIMKIIETHMRINKIIKILKQIYARITNIMKIKENH